MLLQPDQPIRLQYPHQIKLFNNVVYWCLFIGLTTSETCHGSNNIAGQCPHLQCSSGWHLACVNFQCTCVQNSPNHTGKYLSILYFKWNVKRNKFCASSQIFPTGRIRKSCSIYDMRRVTHVKIYMKFFP